MNKIMAIWKKHNGEYDEYRGAEIISFNENGFAYVTTGKGIPFYTDPLVVIDYEAGARLLTELHQIYYQMLDEESAVASRYHKAIKDIFNKVRQEGI